MLACDQNIIVFKSNVSLDLFVHINSTFKKYIHDWVDKNSCDNEMNKDEVVLISLFSKSRVTTIYVKGNQINPKLS